MTIEQKNDDSDKTICLFHIQYAEIYKVLNEIKGISETSGYLIFSVENNILKLAAEDLTSSIVIETPVEFLKSYDMEDTHHTVVDKERVVHSQCIAFKIKTVVIFNLIRKLREKTLVSIRVFSEHILITQGESNYVLFTIRHPDSLIKYSLSSPLSMESLSLDSALKSVSFAGAKEEVEQFNGVYLNFMKDKLVSFATDKSRLSVYKMECSFSKELKVFIRTKAVNQILKLLSPLGDSLISIEKINNELVITSGNIFYRTQLGSSEQQINYEKILEPRANFVEISMKRGDLKGVIGRISIVSTTLSNYVNLKVENNILEFSAYDPNTGFFKESYSIDYSQESFSIKVNIKYIADVINNGNTNEIKLLLQKVGPLIIHGGPVKHCIMPIRL